MCVCAYISFVFPMASIVTFDNGLLRISPSGRQIEFSGNGGYAWTQRSNCSDFGRINDLLAEGMYVYAACSNGLFRSGNGGYAWTLVAQRGSYGEFLNIGGNLQRLFAATSQGFFMSTNEGGTWTLLHS